MKSNNSGGGGGAEGAVVPPENLTILFFNSRKWHRNVNVYHTLKSYFRAIRLHVFIKSSAPPRILIRVWP